MKKLLTTKQKLMKTNEQESEIEKIQMRLSLSVFPTFTFSTGAP